MYAAQEMFKTANKVTRPEKALILGFMAGSRGTAAIWLFHSHLFIIIVSVLPQWFNICHSVDMTDTSL